MTFSKVKKGKYDLNNNPVWLPASGISNLKVSLTLPFFPPPTGAWGRAREEGEGGAQGGGRQKRAKENEKKAKAKSVSKNNIKYDSADDVFLRAGGGRRARREGGRMGGGGGGALLRYAKNKRERHSNRRPSILVCATNQERKG